MQRVTDLRDSLSGMSIDLSDLEQALDDAEEVVTPEEVRQSAEHIAALGKRSAEHPRP